MTWNTNMDEAPRDYLNGRILVAERGTKQVYEVSWMKDWYGDESNPGWMIANCDEEYGRYIDAVAWMPLPAHPETNHDPE